MARESRYLCENCVICVRRLENCVIRVTVWLLLRWIDSAKTAAREGCVSYHGQGHQRRKEGSFWVHSVSNARILYRSRQDDRLRVMLVLVHIDITPPQV
ncbi:uncharacterized protein TNCV_3404271 [Trichonephila clavipes]|nr:uncharacterized protein TNCV_3404271 [Trichonephila clavipes]